MITKRNLPTAGLVAACALFTACSGAGGGASTSSSGGKSSTLPLIINLQANPRPAWLNAAVTFSVTCQSVVSSSDSLTYVWTFGDGATETTTTDTDVHAYTTAGNYPYSVTCQDATQSGTQSSSIQSTSALMVQNYDLNVVSLGTCSSGKQGHAWCWQRPLPTGARLRTLAAITPLSSWIAGDGGAVLRTDDGGQHWVPEFPTTSSNFVSIHASDHNHITLTASDASVWSTPDAGQSWTHAVPTSGSFALTHASMADAQHIWAINGGTGIVQTSNGGSSWNTIDIMGGMPSGTQFNAISVGDLNTVWAVGNAPGQGQTAGVGVTAHTSDGTNWSSGGSPLAAGMMLNTVSVTSGSRCSPSGPATGSVWTAGLDTALSGASGVESAESVDGGMSWNTSNTGGGSLITAFDSNTAFQTLPLGTQTFGGNPLNDGFGVTTAGNLHWQFANPNYPFYATVPSDESVFPAINAIDSADCHTAWAVGNAGTVLTTTDSGVTWIGQAAAANPTTANNLTSLVASSPKHAYVLAVDANAKSQVDTAFFTVLITTDGGTTWLTDFGPLQTMALLLPQTYIQDVGQLLVGQIAANAAGDVVAVGPGFVITNSALPNHTWHYHTSTDSDEAANVVSPPVPGGQTSWGSKILITEIVPPQGVPPNQAYEVWRAASVSAKTAWVIDGLGDVIEQDTPLDNGSKGVWTLVAGASTLPHQPAAQPPPPGGNAIAAIDLPSGVVAVLVGSGGLISRTADMGNTWVTVPSGTTANLNAIAVVADGSAAGVGWAVGAGGTLLRTTDGGASWKAQSWSDPTVSSANLNFVSISTVDGQTAMALAQAGNCSENCNFVLRTDDGGSTWTRQAIGSEGINSVTMVDSNNAWIVGLNGVILKTVTGGTDPSD